MGNIFQRRKNRAGSDESDALLRDVLLELFSSTIGENWSIRKNWCRNAPVLEWHGIRLHGARNTLEINLYGNNLCGATNLNNFLFEHPNKIISSVNQPR